MESEQTLGTAEMKQSTVTSEQILGTAEKPTHVAISFDTTGSMSPCIADVRQKLKNLSEEMFKDIPGLKIALIAHGDYCDGDNCIKKLDFTNDLDAIMTFLESTPNTGGGDEPECYEYVFSIARDLSWPAEGGSLMMAGDARPHELNELVVNSLLTSIKLTNTIDWRTECAALKEMKIKVFPLQCLRYENSRNNPFWEAVAEIFGTPLLQLTDFRESAANVEAVMYAAAGEAAYDKYEAKISTSGLSPEYMVNASNLKSYLKTSKD